jgi:hypothetical protein
VSIPTSTLSRNLSLFVSECSTITSAASQHHPIAPPNPVRGGMDASQYKDYVLVLLFIKYVSDKYAGVPYASITVPEGASFKDMVALKGTSDIGDQINKKIIGPLALANKLSDMPDSTHHPAPTYTLTKACRTNRDHQRPAQALP